MLDETVNRQTPRLRHNGLWRTTPRRDAPTVSPEGLPIIQVRKTDRARVAGFIILPIAGILLIVKLPVTLVLTVSWVLLLGTLAYLALTITRLDRTSTTRTVDIIEMHGELLDKLTGPHDTNLQSMLRRMRDLERDHAQLSEVVTQCVTWDDVPVSQGGRKEDAA
jgi:hypothetical protein